MTSKTTGHNNNKNTHEKSFATVKYNEQKKGKALHALCPFKEGDVITPFFAQEVFSEPNYLTLQLDAHRHITLLPEGLAFTNHSCAPNIFFDTTSMLVIALKPIETGDELTFFYPSTEWDMAQTFECQCGAENCLHWISGAKFIDPKILNGYRLTDFIQSSIKKKNAG